jgi:uncharacterized protein (TIGR01244 family)
MNIRNFRQVDDRLATAGQPTEEQFSEVANAGYEIVINLGLHDDKRYALPDEPSLVASLGMKYVHIPVQFASPTESDLEVFFRAMDEHRDQRVFVHCAANMRVSTFLGLYDAVHRRKPIDQSFSLMREIWEPNVVWAKFIHDVLSKHGFDASNVVKR